jgi:hypothetical protein
MSQEDQEVMEAAMAAVRRGDLDGFLSLPTQRLSFDRWSLRPKGVPFEVMKVFASGGTP